MKKTVELTAQPRNVQVTGDLVGPFVVHKLWDTGAYVDSRAKWGVTHVGTGASAASGPTKSSCMHAANRLRDLDVDWDFTSPAAVKAFSADQRTAVYVIRAACDKGGEA